MLRKTLAGAVAIALIAAPVGAFAAAGDPGTGIGLPFAIDVGAYSPRMGNFIKTRIWNYIRNLK